MTNRFNDCLAKSPLNVRVYVTFLIISLTILVLVLSMGRYGKQDNVSGLIRNESFYRVSSDKLGNVLELYVKEGDPVSKGDALYRLALPTQKADSDNDDVQDINILKLKKIRAGYVNELTLQENEIQTQRSKKELFLQQIVLELEKIEEIESSYAKKGRLYKKQMSDYELLLKTKSINKSEVERLSQVIIDNDLALTKTLMEKQNILKNKAERELYFVKTERELEQNQNDLKRREVEVDKEIERTEMLKDFIVTSPVDGIIHDIGILKGDFVDGKTPAIIVKERNNSNPIAILYLSSLQIGLISPGNKLILRIDSFPYETYGVLNAEVINVSKTPTKIGFDEKEAWFRVKVKINENTENDKISIDALNDGMTVMTTVREPDQSLIEWLFLPLKKAIKRNPDFYTYEN